MDKNNSNQRPWYKKKRYIISLVALGLIGVFNSNDSKSSQIYSTPSAPSTYNASTYQPASTIDSLSSPLLKSNIKTNSNNSLSNDNYYTNVNGNTVHSPAYSNSGSIPSGASARCRDGTYSFSQNHRGTCSHHGGIAEWL